MVAITWILLTRRNKGKGAAAAAIVGEVSFSSEWFNAEPVDVNAFKQADPDGNKTSQGLGFQDLTDKENPDFRYVT